ncbi:MAG: DUF3080 family protein [Alcanivoracaceae bacterium]|nr:DUF3080 family protein [Alcanivoracaceae bacterium]
MTTDAIRTARHVGLALMLLLAGCGNPGADGLWQDYQQRLARLARSEVPPATPWARPLWPAPRDIRVATPEWRSGLLRYLDMAGCDLMELVASRNSGLGRVQQPVNRFDYELRFVDEAGRCLAADTLDDDPDMRQWLATLQAEKHQALPAMYWNTVVAGTELAGFLAQGDIPGTPPLLPERNQVWHALGRLGQWPARLAGSPVPADAQTLRADLRTLDLSRAGTVLDAMALANRELPRATAILRGVDTAALCPAGRASQRARYFDNVLHRIYAANLQPWLSDTWRSSEQLSQLLGTLLLDPPQPRPAVADWHQRLFGPGGLRSQMATHMADHTRAWQQLLGDCGLMPDKPLT